jgi:hypothetical protein
VARSSGGEAVRRPGNGVDRLGGGAGRRRRAEQTEKKNGENGGEVGGRRLFFLAARWRDAKRKNARGSRGSAPRGGENGEERGGPGTVVTPRVSNPCDYVNHVFTIP